MLHPRGRLVRMVIINWLTLSLGKVTSSLCECGDEKEVKKKLKQSDVWPLARRHRGEGERQAEEWSHTCFFLCCPFVETALAAAVWPVLDGVTLLACLDHLFPPVPLRRRNMKPELRVDVHQRLGA